MIKLRYQIKRGIKNEIIIGRTVHENVSAHRGDWS